MSQQDANDWTPEQAAASGYPVPDSSPAMSGENEGAPPAPTGAPPDPAQNDHNYPPEGSKRWNQMYLKAQRYEEENAELQQRIARYESLEQPMGVAPPPPPQQPTPTSPQDDPEAWLENTITGALDKRLAPLEQAITAQQQTQQLAQQAAQFRAANPAYNDTTDSARLLGTFRKYGGKVSLDDCFRMSFPERFAQPQQEPQGAPAPVADVPSSAPETPFGTETPATLMAKLANPNLTAYEREQIASQLRDMGAWGMGTVEQQLGYK